MDGKNLWLKYTHSIAPEVLHFHWYLLFWLKRAEFLWRVARVERMQRDLCVYGAFFIWLKSLRRFILGYFFVWEITSKGSQWKEGNLMGTYQSKSLENVVKTTGWSDQWGCKISFGISSHLLKSSGIGSVLRATHMVVGFIRRTFVLREGWTEEPQGRSESHLWSAWGIWHGDG